MIRLLYLVSHPIQYQAPLLRRIAAEPSIDLRVLFERVDTASDYFDDGFGRKIRWDVELRGGYSNAPLSETSLITEIRAADAVWMHGWHSPMLLRALGLAKICRRPVLMRGENQDQAMPDGFGPRGWLKRRYLGWIFRRCAAFLAIGGANRDYYLARGIGPERIFPMPYAVDNAAFATQAAQADRVGLRRELGIPDGAKVVLFAGKFQRRKRPDLLVDAWRRLARPRPVLLMVGDGEMRAGLEAEFEPGMIFTGFRNQGQLPGLYALADAFVLPSEREPWGLAVNEAMACGTPVVVSDQVAAGRDLVEQACGAIFPAGDAQTLADALERVLNRSDAMGQAAAARVNQWDFEADVAGLNRALAFVCGGRA